MDGSRQTRGGCFCSFARNCLNELSRVGWLLSCGQRVGRVSGAAMSVVGHSRRLRDVRRRSDLYPASDVSRPGRHFTGKVPPRDEALKAHEIAAALDFRGTTRCTHSPTFERIQSWPGAGPGHSRLWKINARRVPKNKKNQRVAARNYCGKFATFVGRTNRPSPLWDRPLAALRWFQGGEVHGVGNRALHPLERTSHCPGDSLFGHGAGRPGPVRDGGCSFSRNRPGQGADEVEAETSGQGRSDG